MNDERPIEKLLRRYAKKRRDDAGAPLEMHTATRRMLQGEVARQFPKPVAGEREPTTFAQIMIGWRTRLVWAVPAVIALGIGLWALVGTNEKSDIEFEMAKTAPEPAAPATAVEESFKALEADKAAAPTPATGLANQPTLAFADRDVPREAPESTSRIPTSLKDGVSVSLTDKTAYQKQGDAAKFGDLAAASRIEPELKLESGRVAATELAQSSPADETHSLNVVAKRASAEPAITIGIEKTQALGLVLASKAKSDSPNAYYSARRDDVSEVQGQLAGVPASRPAALAPDASGRFYRQEGRGGSEREHIQVYSQAFANRTPVPRNAKSAKSGPITPVLANFQVEQSGNQLRVIDGDGSTYVGEVNAPAEQQFAKVEVETKGGGKLAVPRDSQRAARQMQSTSSAGPQTAQRFAYRVAGTNRTLQQQVVFTWNFEALTNGLAAVQVKVPPGGGNVLNQLVPAQQFPVLLNNSIINGRAQLGGAKEIEVNAVPVSP